MGIDRTTIEADPMPIHFKPAPMINALKQVDPGFSPIVFTTLPVCSGLHPIGFEAK